LDSRAKKKHSVFGKSHRPTHPTKMYASLLRCTAANWRRFLWGGWGPWRFKFGCSPLPPFPPAGDRPVATQVRLFPPSPLPPRWRSLTAAQAPALTLAPALAPASAPASAPAPASAQAPAFINMYTYRCLCLCPSIYICIHKNLYIYIYIYMCISISIYI
jgi:hypothetical protein